jgi:NADH-quinone oxidoreductase subunit J
VAGVTGLDLLFLGASAIAAGASALVVTRRNPIHSAAWMMAALFAVAVVFLLLHATFAAVIQVLLYAGAILVLFLFVIMLLNPGPEEAAAERVPAAGRVLAGVFAVMLLAAIAASLTSSGLGALAPFSAGDAPQPPAEFGTTAWFGGTVYDEYLLAFEAISLLIMAAIAGTIVLAKRRVDGDEEEAPAKAQPRRKERGAAKAREAEVEKVASSGH